MHKTWGAPALASALGHKHTQPSSSKGGPAGTTYPVDWAGLSARHNDPTVTNHGDVWFPGAKSRSKDKHVSFRPLWTTTTFVWTAALALGSGESTVNVLAVLRPMYLCCWAQIMLLSMTREVYLSQPSLDGDGPRAPPPETGRLCAPRFLSPAGDRSGRFPEGHLLDRCLLHTTQQPSWRIRKSAFQHRDNK